MLKKYISKQSTFTVLNMYSKDLKSLKNERKTNVFMHTNVITAFIINFYIYCKTFPKIQLHFSPKNLSELLTEMHILIKY